MSKWKIFSRESVYKTKLFNVVKTELELSNKNKRTYYTAERKPSVFIFPLSQNYEIYLIKQYRYMLGKEVIEAAAGFIDNGETPQTAAKRELKEETGLLASDWISLAKIDLAASVFKSQAEMFLARGLKFGTQALEEGEDIEVIKLSLRDALDMISSGKINESGTMVGILLIDKLRRDKKI